MNFDIYYTIYYKFLWFGKLLLLKLFNYSQAAEKDQEMEHIQQMQRLNLDVKVNHDQVRNHDLKFGVVLHNP